MDTSNGEGRRERMNLTGCMTFVFKGILVLFGLAFVGFGVAAILGGSILEILLGILIVICGAALVLGTLFFLP
jgi:hypothetical protein